MANFSVDLSDNYTSTDVFGDPGSPAGPFTTTTVLPNATTPSSLLKTIEKEFNDLPKDFFAV